MFMHPKHSESSKWTPATLRDARRCSSASVPRNYLTLGRRFRDSSASRPCPSACSRCSTLYINQDIIISWLFIRLLIKLFIRLIALNRNVPSPQQVPDCGNDPKTTDRTNFHNLSTSFYCSFLNLPFFWIPFKLHGQRRISMATIR